MQEMSASIAEVSRHTQSAAETARSAAETAFQVSAARAAAWLQLSELPDRFEVRQVLDDPEGWHDCSIVAEVDTRGPDSIRLGMWGTAMAAIGANRK